MKLNKKTIWYSIPIIFGGYLILKQFSKKASSSDYKDATQPPAPSPIPSSFFPIQKGSKNEAVSSLQSLMNTVFSCQKKTLLVVDGIFGDKTNAALVSLSGSSSIKNQEEFDAFKNKLASMCQKSSDLDWAWKLIEAQNTGNYSSLVVKSPVNLYKVVKNFQGLWMPASPYKQIVLPPLSYNLNDYKLQSATNSGGLRIEITSGEFAGTYLTVSGTNIQGSFNIA